MEEEVQNNEAIQESAPTPDKTPLEKVYGALKTRNPNLPDFDRFKEDMQNPDNLKRVHESLLKRNPNLPDFDKFKTDMGIAPPKGSVTEALQGYESPVNANPTREDITNAIGYSPEQAQKDELSKLGYRESTDVVQNIRNLKQLGLPVNEHIKGLREHLDDIAIAPVKAMYEGIKSGTEELVRSGAIPGVGVPQMGGIGDIIRSDLQALEGGAKVGFALLHVVPAAAAPMAAFDMGIEVASKILPEKAIGYIMSPVSSAIQGLGVENESVKALAGLTDIGWNMLAIHGLHEAGKNMKGKTTEWTNPDEIATKIENNEPLTEKEVNDAAKHIGSLTPQQLQTAAKQTVVNSVHEDLRPTLEKKISLETDQQNIAKTVGDDVAQTLTPDVEKAQQDFAQQTELVQKREKLRAALELANTEGAKKSIQGQLVETQKGIEQLGGAPKVDQPAAQQELERLKVNESDSPEIKARAEEERNSLLKDPIKYADEKIADLQEKVGLAANSNEPNRAEHIQFLNDEIAHYEKLKKESGEQSQKSDVEKAISVLPKPTKAENPHGKLYNLVDKVMSKMTNRGTVQEEVSNENANSQSEYDSKVALLKSNPELAKAYHNASDEQRVLLDDYMSSMSKADGESYDANSIRTYHYVRNDGTLAFSGKGLSIKITDFDNVPRTDDGKIDFEKSKYEVVGADGKTIKSGLGLSESMHLLQEETNKYKLKKESTENTPQPKAKVTEGEQIPKSDAIQEQSPSGLLQYPQETVSQTGGERTGMESSKQRETPAQPSEEEKITESLPAEQAEAPKKVSLNSEEKSIIKEEGLNENDFSSTRNFFKKPYQEKGLPNIGEGKGKDFIEDESNAKEQVVSIDDIIPTQRIVENSSLGNRMGENDIPILLKNGNEFFVLDGHHRIATEARDGKTDVKAQVFDVTDLKLPTYEESTAVKEKATPIAEEKKVAPVSEEAQKGFTNVKVINDGYKNLKDKIGEKKAQKYFNQVDKLIDPNKNTIVEYRENGVVTKEGDKYTFHALADMDGKKWRVSFKSDVSDQFAKSEAPIETAKKIATEHGYSDNPRKMLNSIEKNTGERFLTVQEAVASDNPKVKAFLEGKKVSEVKGETKTVKTESGLTVKYTLPEELLKTIADAKKEKASENNKKLAIQSIDKSIKHYEGLRETEGIDNKKLDDLLGRLRKERDDLSKSEVKPSEPTGKEIEPIKDINGKEIKVGDTVKTQQPSGGLMPPAPAKTGVVEETTDAFGNKTLQIKFRQEGKNYDQFILLDGKENEIVSPSVEPKAEKTKTEVSGEKLAKAKTKLSNKLRGQTQMGGLNALPEFVEYVKTFIEHYGNKAEDFIKHWRENFPESKHSDKEIKDAFEGIKGEPKITGVSEAAQAARAEELGVEPAERLAGVTREQAVEKGRELISKGADAEKIAEEYKKTKKISIDDFNVLTAHADELAKETNRAADKFGADSKEFKEAWDMENEWNKEIVNPIANEFFHQTGMRLQSQVEVDTGTLAGLQRAFQREYKKEMTPKQVREAKELATKVKTLTEQVESLQKKLADAIEAAVKEDSKSPRKIKEKAKQLADTIRKGKLSRPDVFSAASPASVVWDGAIEIAAKTVEAGGTIAQAVADGLNHIQNSDWYQNLEAKKRGEADKAFSDFIKDKQEIDIATHFIGKKDSKFTPEEIKAIWNHAKASYLDQGKTYDDMLNGVSTDTGLTKNQVRRAISQPKGAKRITDEMYRQQYKRNQAVGKAKQWVRTADTPLLNKFLKAIPAFFFEKAIAGHGTVGMITHSGMNIFNPSTWRSYWTNFGRQFKYLTNVAEYEKAKDDLQDKPNYILAKRAGLANDPTSIYDDYAGLKKFFGKFGTAGDRGFFALKTFRQELFDHYYDKLSDAEKADPDMAKEIARIVNHATGTSKIPVPDAISTAIFAPRLEASRWSRLVTQPVKALNTLKNWKDATPSEKAAAKIIAKRAATMVSVYLAGLAANQGLLSASGSDKKINFNNPLKSDWLKFKAGDKTIDVTGGMVSALHFIANIIALPFLTKKDLKGESVGGKAEKNIGDYLRGKLSPFGSTTIEAFTSHDYAGNTMPYSNEPPVHKYNHKMTWKEYLWSQAPIPAAEAAKDVYMEMEKKGLSEPRIEEIFSGIFIGIVSGGTGTRVGVAPKEKPSISPLDLKSLIMERPEKLETEKMELEKVK